MRQRERAPGALPPSCSCKSGRQATKPRLRYGGGGGCARDGVVGKSMGAQKKGRRAAGDAGSPATVVSVRSRGARRGRCVGPALPPVTAATVGPSGSGAATVARGGRRSPRRGWPCGASWGEGHGQKHRACGYSCRAAAAAAMEATAVVTEKAVEVATTAVGVAAAAVGVAAAAAAAEAAVATTPTPPSVARTPASGARTCRGARGEEGSGHDPPRRRPIIRLCARGRETTRRRQGAVRAHARRGSPPRPPPRRLSHPLAPGSLRAPTSVYPTRAAEKPRVY